MKIDFNISELTLENMGSWPWAIKITSCAIICIFIFVVGYFVDTSAKIDELNLIVSQEQDLRQEFEKKQHLSASLEAYKLQLAEMKKTFGTLLQQLPSKTELPGLLEDISKAGVASGLEFRLFNPQKEILYEFYAELPIRIIVVGNYQQFGQFISRMAALNRIVTVHDYDIKRYTPANSPTPKPGELALREKSLEMQLTAKTYRYVDEPGEQKS